MTPVHRVVALAALLGTTAQLTVLHALGDAGPVVPPTGVLGGASPGVLVVGVLLLTVAGDLLSVPVRRGEQTEAMTLLEAAVVVSVLLLPARDALWIPVAAVALTSLLERRAVVKSVFNVGTHAAATALLVLVVHLLSGPGQGLVWQTVLGVVLGLLAFSAVNLVMLSRVLTVLGDSDAPQVLSDGVRLTLVNAAATVALAGGSVVAVGAAPTLLPFSLVPAVALVYAYRAAAQSSEHRLRSARLLALSHVLAGRVECDEVLPAFLSQCRQAFGADLALAVLGPRMAPEHAGGLTVLDAADGGPTSRPTSAADRDLLRGRSDGGLVTGPLPDGWTQAIAAPLEADGEPLGTLLLATRDRTRQLGADELPLLVPLASALAVALRGAAHLRRLTEATSKLQAVVDQSSDGILVLDGAGVVQLWSPAMRSLTGTDETTAYGRPLSALVQVLGADGTPCDAFDAGRALLSPGSPQATVEMTLLGDDGDQRVVRCAHAGVFSDEGLLVRDVVIVHDVTRERQVERLKADFIATVSHELRTPVTPIKGYADLLRRRGDSMTPERRDECLAVIGDRCDHLARLVEDLLLASRISATEGGAPAQVSMTSDDLVVLVRRAAGDFGSDGERVRVVLPDEPVRVACDPVRVTQVLTNLVGNALKYSAGGTPVDVTVAVEDGQARVTVADRGRGIPADQLERVFEKFHRLEDPLRMSTGGTGLGLYIARHLSSAMGGSLHCTSTLGVGSQFHFALQLAGTLPLPAPRSGGAPDAPEGAGRRSAPAGLR